MEETTVEASGSVLERIVNEIRAAWKELPEEEFLELASNVKKLLSKAPGFHDNS